MANFNMHLNSAAFVSAISASVLSYKGVITGSEAFFCFLAGMIGGVLPDIDHNNSKIINMMQLTFSLFISFFITLMFINRLKLLELLGLWIGVYLFIMGLFFIFKKFTTHRGIIHSIPFAFLFWFLVTLISYYLGISVKMSYLIGFFVFLGYITHLLLDEIYAVDLMGRRLKSSFGSALKFNSYNKLATFLTYLALVGLFLLLPKKEYLFSLIKGIFDV